MYKKFLLATGRENVASTVYFCPEIDGLWDVRGPDAGELIITPPFPLLEDVSELTKPQELTEYQASLVRIL